MPPSPHPATIPPLCMVCAHLHSGARVPACDAFPERIPEEILAGEGHVDSFPGDHGIAFRKTSGDVSFFFAETNIPTLFRVTCAGSYERYVPILDLWELDNRFIKYILAVPIAFRAADPSEADAFMESSRECLESMNPCMREIRRMMYIRTGEHEVP